MTEQEWRESESPELMRAYLEEARRGTERQFRLFAVACCRRAERWFFDSCQSRAVNVLERYADGSATVDELREPEDAANEIDELHPAMSEANEANPDGLDAAYNAARSVAQAVSNDPPGMDVPTYYHCLHDVIMHVVDAAGDGAVALDAVKGRSRPAQAEERKALAALLRDIFGNPFRPVALDPVWLTADVPALARGIYDERAFDRMPILADALQDAGCNDAEILSHCADARNPHTRGCWVLDLVLGRA
jgi:hypothetical protein